MFYLLLFFWEYAAGIIVGSIWSANKERGVRRNYNALHFLTCNLAISSHNRHKRPMALRPYLTISVLTRFHFAAMTKRFRCIDLGTTKNFFPARKLLYHKVYEMTMVLESCYGIQHVTKLETGKTSDWNQVKSIASGRCPNEPV